MRNILAKINILANAFEKDGNLETADLLHNVFVKISKKKKSKSKKNVPNNPSLWASCQAWAKKTYDTHPSAYSNAGAARRYKQKGGTWRKASVENNRFAEDNQTLLSGTAAGEKLRNFIFNENGDFQYLKALADDFIQKLNVEPNSIETLKNLAIYLIRLKINEPNLDETLFFDATNALGAARRLTNNDEIHAQNIGSINNYLRKQVQKFKISPKVYFTALEMARLKSTGQAPGAN